MYGFKFELITLKEEGVFIIIVFIYSTQFCKCCVPGPRDLFYLLTITHHSLGTTAVTRAALCEDMVYLMSGLAGGWCVGAPPPALGSDLVTVVVTQL